MKFKLDENLGTTVQQIFKVNGHDVQTVISQGLGGCSDQHLYEKCCSEQRCLVTLDLDFANVISFPPFQANGIVVFRTPHTPNLFLLEQMVMQFLDTLSHISVEKGLWIVEVGRIRIHESDIDEED